MKIVSLGWHACKQTWRTEGRALRSKTHLVPRHLYRFEGLNLHTDNICW